MIPFYHHFTRKTVKVERDYIKYTQLTTNKWIKTQSQLLDAVLLITV